VGAGRFCRFRAVIFGLTGSLLLAVVGSFVYD
jgi:hypothetical protein